MRDRLNFVGEIKTPYNNINDCPSNISPQGPQCKIVIYDEYINEMVGLRSGQTILVLYWLDMADPTKKTFFGAFALRTPHRPNPIAAAVLKIDSIDGNTIIVNGLDCLNGTRLLDIKPAIYEEKNQSITF